MTLGALSDIIIICVYVWYEWTYYSNHGDLPENIEKLGRLIAPVKNDGDKMSQVILTIKVTVVTRKTLPKLQKSELVCESEKKKCNIFDNFIEKKLGSSMSYTDNTTPVSYIYYEDDSEESPP